MTAPVAFVNLDRWGDADRARFKIEASGESRPWWRVLTPEEPDGQRRQFVCATFASAIQVMDTWIRFRRPGAAVSMTPAALYTAICEGRIQR